MAKGDNKKRNTRKDKQQRGEEREVKDKFMEERNNSLPPILPKTKNQKTYFQKLRTEKLVAVRSPAGCGKTFIPATLAADAYLRGEINKIIIARPSVSMGKEIGHRPGNDFQKLEMFLKPMLTAIKKRVGGGRFDIMLSSGDLAVQSLDAIRGMSFDEPCVLICDEFQNTTPDEVKSIVTRVGEDCQMICCGDPKQTDIRGENGIDYLVGIIEKYEIPEACVVEMTVDDIVRSDMAKDFVIAFEKEYDGRKNG